MCARNVGGNRAPSTPFPHPRRRRTRELPSRRPVNTPFPPHAETPPPRSATCASFPLFLFPFSLPSPFSFLSFLFLPFFAGRTRDGRRHRDVSGWNGLLLAIVSVFFPGKTRVLGGMDGCAFSFFFFFPPAFLNEPMEASVERRLRFGLYRLILRCKLNFLEREREGVFLRDK